MTAPLWGYLAIVKRLSTNRALWLKQHAIGSSAARSVLTAARLALLFVWALVLGGCAGANVAVESTRLPVPVIEALPINVGIHLSDELKGFTHEEAIRDFGTYTISVGPAQNLMFNNLATGMFAAHRFVDRGEDLPAGLNAVLVPSIKELQFSIPQQTKSDFFEVWLKYNFRLITPDGTAIANWPMQAYGRANARNYGLLEDTSNGALQEAARGALRDAMAVFTFKFRRVPGVAAWLEQYTAPTAKPAATGPEQQPGQPTETESNGNSNPSLEGGS